MPGLYIHIPFCAKKCHYCNFVITTEGSKDARERFLCAIEQEIKSVTAKYGRVGFETLYLGGGTPSILSSDEMQRFVQLLRDSFDFNEGLEFTCEVNPGDMSLEKAKAYRELGVNRISIGAQAFQDSLLQSMNRAHGTQAIFETMGFLREAGFENISLDLMTRLPDQSMEAWEESLRSAISFNPTQVVVYELEVHAGTVYGRRYKDHQLVLPPEELHVEMAELADKMLESANYDHYELMTYAKQGFKSKHNLLYWKNQEYLGLGPGAFSYMKGARYQFAKEVNRYYEKCAANDWSNDVEDILTEDQKEVETLLTGLRLKEGVCLKALSRVGPKIQAILESFIEEGLLEVKNQKVLLTPRGRFVSESIFAKLVSVLIP